MSFDINTNITSLQAQQYLNVNSAFQAKTINRVTSGLRIINSGDDAAGLAVANGYRSDQAVLTQGIRNANDGLSTLQTIDGGVNNISQLLDRARTLATQSASGTFNGDRNLLNSEFTSVLSEISRQAQAIGLNSGGTFAKSLSVFIGGGRGTSATDANAQDVINNGSVSVDLSNSAVDAAGLGLQGVAAVGTAGTNLNVTQVLATGNQTATSGAALFYLSGAGFSGANKVAVSVTTTNVQTVSQLVANANAAIASAAAGTSPAAQALSAANVQAYTNTDSAGKQQLAFKSANAAFQVDAGDQMANALLGNVTAPGAFTGKSLTKTVTGGATVNSVITNTIVRIQGGGLASPVDITVASGLTGQQAVDSLATQVNANTKLQAAGISVNDPTLTGALIFTSNTGENFDVQAAGDTGGVLGLGKYQLSTAAATSYDYTTKTGNYTAATQASTLLDFSIAGGATQTITVAGLDQSLTSATMAAGLVNAQIALNATLLASGLTATAAAGGATITFATPAASGTEFRLNVNTSAANVFGFGVGVGAAPAASDIVSTAASATNNVHFDSGGAYETTPQLAFTPIQLGTDVQTLSFSAPNAAGTAQSTQVVLQNNGLNGQARNARSIEEAIDTINTALQASGNATLKQIVAVKEYNGSNEGVAFMSAGGAFQVTVGSTGSGAGLGSSAQQGKVTTATLQAGGSTVAIDQQSNAATAVTALSNAVAALGAAQAVVGKGENQFNYAINLAQSQNTNLAAAESRIRDADLAAEAANLTKAQILIQAGTAALAQANTSSQAVLALLK
jgi:flagellin